MSTREERRVLAREYIECWLTHKYRLFYSFFSTIPIAKRRYYGRVQQAVHDFLSMGPDVVKGEPQAAAIQFFFDPQGVVVVPAKKKDINGQCTKKDGDCRGKEIRDSRFNDMVSKRELACQQHSFVSTVILTLYRHSRKRACTYSPTRFARINKSHRIAFPP